MYMVLLFATILIALVLSMVWNAFGIVRNEWVFKQHMKVIDHIYDMSTEEWVAAGKPDSDDYLSLDGYDEMCRKFWIWDLNKFLKKPLP